MGGNRHDVLLDYYHRELDYLRAMGGEFAQAYPKVAERLELSDRESADPHVERLLESFAFLTGRIQHQIDNEFPEIPTALLEILYPQLVQTIPSMTVARFTVDPAQYKPDGPNIVPRHTPLLAEESRGRNCTFTTCYDVGLWPVEISEASFEEPARYNLPGTMAAGVAVLRLRVRTLNKKAPFSKFTIDRLRIHVGQGMRKGPELCELLFAHCAGVALLPNGDEQAMAVDIGADALSQVGFAADEAVLPYPDTAHQAYRLLQEYFTFPEKFHFVDIAGLEVHGSAESFDILILLDRAPPKTMAVEAADFSLGCTPAINLFPKVSDAVRIDETKYEYPLVVEGTRERLMEVHTVKSVRALEQPGGTPGTLEPLFSYNHAAAAKGEGAFWITRRRPTGLPGLPGTRTTVSFVDEDFQPTEPAKKMVLAETLCTNRDVAAKVPPGAKLHIEVNVPALDIRCLTRPTLPIEPHLGGKALWRLVSQLSLNHLSLSAAPDNLTALREILRLHATSEHSSVHLQINGIHALECRRSARAVGEGAWFGFCRGTDVTVTFDERHFVSAGASAILLASVLNRFLGLYVAANAYTRLGVKSLQRDGTWKIWPPLTGEKEVL